MKEDYLLDKTGEDEEIRQLEDTLAVFRYQPATPPHMPFKFQSTPAPVSIWRAVGFRLALAFSAVAVVATLTWTTVQKGVPVQQGVENAFVTMPTVPEPAAEVREGDIGLSIQAAHNFPDDITQVRPDRKNRMAAKTLKAAKRTAVRKSERPFLTAEEKHAYDEVRRALSISGEKLRIIKDTIDGIETTGRTSGR